jgi:hypothetical protein
MVLALLLAQATTEPVFPDIAFQLEGMVMADQEARNHWIEEVQKPNADQAKIEKLAQFTMEQDRQNTAMLKGWVDQYGWLGKRLVGVEGAHNAWLLVQHADLDKPFQKRCLALMEKMLGTGEIKDTDFAYLYDRVATGEGRKQRYGTQMHSVNGKYEPFPCEDPRNLDRRRAAVGMMPMADYIKLIEEMYGKPKG